MGPCEIKWIVSREEQYRTVTAKVTGSSPVQSAKINKMDKYNKETFSIIVEKSLNYKDVCRQLNIGTTYGNRQTIKNYIIKYGLNVVDNRTLKNQILKHKLLEYKCVGENCDCTGEWLGKPIALQLDHKNGVNNDNRIENLRFLCPNCHSQTSTFSGRNIK